MEEKKKGILTWIKAHRGELIIAGVSIVAIIFAIICAKNNEELSEIWSTLKASIKVPVTPTSALSEPTPIPSVNKITEVMDISESMILEGKQTTPILFDVAQHIRKLPLGWNPSPEKIAEAESLGIVLDAGHTIVDAYQKKGKVA